MRCQMTVVGDAELLLGSRKMGASAEMWGILSSAMSAYLLSGKQVFLQRLVRTVIR